MIFKWGDIEKKILNFARNIVHSLFYLSRFSITRNRYNDNTKHIKNIKA